MTTSVFHHPLRLSALGLAVLAVCPLAVANDEVDALINPDSSFSVGVGYPSGDSRRFGQYTGYDHSSALAHLDVDYNRRHNETGYWTRIAARQIGLNSPSLSVEAEKQGQWSLAARYEMLERLDVKTYRNLPAMVTSNGAALPRGTAQFALKREKAALGGVVHLSKALSAQVNYTHESKKGLRNFNTGSSGLFLAEPVNTLTQQLEATVNYTTDAFQLSGGYVGSLFQNDVSWVGTGPTSKVALAPDNHAHQVFLTGGATLGAATRAHFKLAFGRGVQNETFDNSVVATGTLPTLAGIGNSLQGKLDTTLVQLGLSSRLSPALNLTAQLRYEDRDDKTPQRTFVRVNTTVRDNTPLDNRFALGKVDLSYRAPLNVTLVGGLAHEQRDRSVLSDNALPSAADPDGADYRQISWRAKNKETSFKLEARKALGDLASGQVGLYHQDRSGSQFLPSNTGSTLKLGVIAPIHFADRKRDRFKASVDFTPLDNLSFQVAAQAAWDKYNGRPFAVNTSYPTVNAIGLGPQHGRQHLFSADMAYNPADDWLMTAWLSKDHNTLVQRQGDSVTATGGTAWQSDMTADAWDTGLGLEGKWDDTLTLGTRVSYSHTKAKTNLAVVGGTAQAVPVVPTITVKHEGLNVFGVKQITPKLAVRADWVFDRYQSNDWTWNDINYTNGVTVSDERNTRTNFFGVTFIYALD